jgi:hypothetical protein
MYTNTITGYDAASFDVQLLTFRRKTDLSVFGEKNINFSRKKHLFLNEEDSS